MRPQCQASDRGPLANEAEPLMETLQPRIQLKAIAAAGSSGSQRIPTLDLLVSERILQDSLTLLTLV